MPTMPLEKPLRFEKMKVLEVTDTHVVFEWFDGKHRSEVPIRDLRRACPCAGCTVEKDKLAANPLGVITGGPIKAYTVEDIASVGRYAVNFLFSDGHSTGIYTFDYLRRLCPCALCVPAGGQPDPGNPRQGD